MLKNINNTLKLAACSMALVLACLGGVDVRAEDDSIPQQEISPSIAPLEAENSVNITTIRRVSKPQQKVASSASSFSMPQINTNEDLNTNWGYGQRENIYNAAIIKSSNDVWPHKDRVPLHPLLLKSLLACESSFNPEAVSYTGAVGIAQLTPETAKRFGLNWSSSRNPTLAIPVGVKVLAEKAKVIIDPGNYHKILGLRPEQCPYATTVAQAYEELGNPSIEQYWHLMLAAYNGGGGTILRAMAIARNRNLDPREWKNLVGDRNNPANSPLYLACTEIFRNGAMNKYRELSEYPVRIIKLYNKSVDPRYEVK
ncbi:transglycosylase SLT domain-containing protein [bacterium]|nr:transglycosylase SLT domain-containing protein [bacterium]